FSTLISLALMDRMVEDLGVGGSLTLLPSILLGSATLSMPLAALTSCAQSACRWREDGELTALSSGGLPLATVVNPVVGLFTAIALVAIPWFHDWAPAAQGRLVADSGNLLRQALVNRARSGRPMVLSTNERLFTGGVSGDWLNDLVYTKREDAGDLEEEGDEEGGPPGTRITILTAKRGRIAFEGGHGWLDCEGVQLEQLTHRRGQSASFAAYRLPLPLSRSQLDPQQESAQPTHQLGHTPEALFEATHRWVLVGLIPLLAGLGLFAGWLTPWPHRAAAFLGSLLPVCFVYLPLLMLSRSLITQGHWSAAALALPCLALACCLPLARRALRERGLQ
ncbi:MAG: LptF/LptG family permease, partial [Dehalococcoidia bacterium]|nr:LptF/LptG family permease [Dehalococcoidia bacterium]